MRPLLLLLLLLCAGCPKSTEPVPTPDLGSTDDVGGDVATTPDANDEPARELVRRVPLAELGPNRLEDPLLSLQNDSWFAVDTNDQTVRVQRIYQPTAPADGAIVGIPAPASGLNCVLGRMKWGEGTHQASVWIGGDAEPTDLVVDLAGLRLDAEPTWTSVPLAPTAETVDVGDGRTWTRWEATGVPSRFGWGYFEVCSGADDVVYFAGPSLESGTMANALVVDVAPRLADTGLVQRIEAFARSRKRATPPPRP